MNDKCCDNCNNSGMTCPGIISRELWDNSKDYCSRYSPLPNKPGKIEPLENRMWQTDVLVGKINEIIAELNRSVK